MRPQLRQDIEREEKRVPYGYYDSRGYLTCGIGFLIDKERGGRIPDAVMNFWLDYILDQIDEEMDTAFPWWRKQPDNVQRALAQMCYQIGLPKLLGFKKMLAALQAGNYGAAKIEGLDSAWAKQTPARATRVTDLFLVHLANTAPLV